MRVVQTFQLSLKTHFWINNKNWCVTFSYVNMCSQICGSENCGLIRYLCLHVSVSERYREKGETEREREKDRMYVCVCMWERERKRERWFNFISSFQLKTSNVLGVIENDRWLISKENCKIRNLLNWFSIENNQPNVYYFCWLY
jgi:hypothetical protein